jgi:hypothetical protein
MPGGASVLAAMVGVQCVQAAGLIEGGERHLQRLGGLLDRRGTQAVGGGGGGTWPPLMRPGWPGFLAS